MKRNIVIFGATGSIGDHVFRVMGQFPDRFQLYGFSFHQNVLKAEQLVHRYQPRYVIQTSEIFSPLGFNSAEKVVYLHGLKALETLCMFPDVHIVVIALAQTMGFKATAKAIRHGKKILFASKELLVVAGEALMQLVHHYKADFIPIDSEHNAVLHALSGSSGRKKIYQPRLIQHIDQITLTASGGSVYHKTLSDLPNCQLEDIMTHPNWKMGNKITVDCATMMNKGLELIELHWLFNAEGLNLNAVLHPESLIHALVFFKNGSVLGSFSEHDMCIPIMYALDLMPGNNHMKMEGVYTLKPMDHEKYPCFSLARQALKEGHMACLLLNAANDIVVEYFMEKKIKFMDIYPLLQRVMDHYPQEHPPKKLDDIIDFYACVKRDIATWLNKYL